MFPFARLCAACTLGFAAVSLATAQQLSPKEAEKQLADAIKAFEKAKVAADEKAAKQFEKLVATAEKSPEIKEAARPAEVDKCQKAKDQFALKREWPDDPSIWQYVDGDPNAWGYRRELDYNIELSRAFGPVSDGYEKALKAHRAAGDDAAVMRLLGERVRLIETHFPGRSGFASGRSWRGNLTGAAGKAVTMRMDLETVKDATFEGTIHQNPELPNNPVYEVAGTVDGNRLVFTRSKVVQGKAVNPNFSGYLSTGRVFLLTPPGVAVGKKGKVKAAGGGYAVLDLQEPKKKKGKK